jgi:23S rRNA pseudouridine1911/1915/1917 synthase
VRVLERLAGATLLECRLETGRQHQIRIHLSEDGTPLLGERVYVRGSAGRVLEASRGEAGRAESGRAEAGRPMLHAVELAFDHPRTGSRVRFEQPPPEDFARLLTTLREGVAPPRARALGQDARAPRGSVRGSRVKP